MSDVIPDPDRPFQGISPRTGEMVYKLVFIPAGTVDPLAPTVAELNAAMDLWCLDIRLTNDSGDSGE